MATRPARSFPGSAAAPARRRFAIAAAAATLAIAVAQSPATAQGAAANSELIVALSAQISSLDPHFHNLTPNNGLVKHVFDTLIATDEFQNLKPGLAESWRATDDTTWEIKLRRGVKWHDGSPFTAEDVIATFKRVPNVPNSPASFAQFVKPISSVQATDSHTLVLKTPAAHPLLPRDLTAVHILSKAVAESARTEDFNSGKAMIGTGPYKYVDYKAGDRVVLERNEGYWGPKPAWTRLQFRMITNGAARVAALLSGDVQMIENVPTADMQRIASNPQLEVKSAVSNRVIYLHMDTGRDKNSPFVRAKDGKPLEENPLRDVRVRKAISKAIDRNAIVERIMEKQAVPAGQFLAPQFFGTSKKLGPEKHDPEGARKLLAEAGYPNGFQLTLHSPNNRYINDEKVAQAVAQFLTRVGIDTKLETMPANIFFSRGSKLEFSFLLAGWGAESGDTSSPLRALVGTFDPSKGNGAANRGRFSNDGLDAMISTALTTIDDTKRGLLLAAASERAMELQGIIPLHFEVSAWGMRKGLSYTPRADQYTLAFEVKPAR
ncbi:MAG TPA: ABC transporter substrate-binding protein [Burkholderiaceae bacterium]|nr:ABC transporter substrate-binding protein [Burkholderiaceae bacterium]